MEEGGMTVVMSPVQLAAVLSDKSVTEAETLSNRLLGGRLTIVYPAIGYGFSRDSTQRISMRSVRIVIELKEYNGKPYYILTVFPTP
ncbi:hypothetical protein HV357_01340 [Enterobacter cloacae]|jgi:hypothetical protein|nr:hypothetical protein [Enterobacter cloacae]HCR2004953.1 hypothetical protein [Enterobacter cloacae subsp. dissolvens]MBA7849160.1 hypothetical protein [Enterobacter cloacae]MCU6230596.1 hypothetical protein [Enterobacter cloacae]HBH7062609.1 hypothetical protein [Enterobacter cloacae]